jgi:hypothetical protein
MGEVKWMWNELHKKIDDGGMAEVMKDGTSTSIWCIPYEVCTCSTTASSQMGVSGTYLE